MSRSLIASNYYYFLCHYNKTDKQIFPYNDHDSGYDFYRWTWSYFFSFPDQPAESFR